MRSNFTKTILAAAGLFFTFSASAQDILQKANQLVQSSANQLGISPTDLQQLQISSAHDDLSSGLTYVYIQQAYKGVKVFNAINSLAFDKNGKLLSATNAFAPKIEVYAANNIPAITPNQAVARTAQYLGRPVPASLTILDDQLATNNRIVYSGGGLSKDKIVVEKYWLKKQNSNDLELVWNVDVDLVQSIDWWNIRINANTGAFEDKNNLTDSDNFGHIPYPAMVTTEKENTAANSKAPLQPSTFNLQPFSPPPTVTTATYFVLPYPIESPIHGSFSNEVNPWTKAGVNSLATTYGWHFDGTTNYNFTRGNDTWAYLDASLTNTNGIQGGDTSSTAIPSLSFLKVFNTGTAPGTNNNRRAAITNLFYWNNILHDITYKYGFTEAAGNFQADNLSRGGAGNDFVLAEAQDGSGTDNANMSTPADGGSPRMQMYLFTATVPGRDGDLDNGVVAHEFFHGVSNRLSGGTMTGSCLDNNEEGGEGWSDYNALMVTTNWATAVMTDSIKSRPMGTYVEGQLITGPGIRRNPYNYNKTINPITYADMASSGEVHNIGEIWCSALWDMTWELCAQTGAISPNLFDSSAAGGNVIAYRLMMQGLKLQPCNPGFIDARDAILKADSILYGYAHRCAIWRAFARRGMGYGASQGSNWATNDQTVSFVVPSIVNVVKTSNVSTAQQNTDITFTLTATCNCLTPLNNYILRDTLQSGYTYVSSSGGVNTAGRITFSGQNFTTEGQSITQTIVAKLVATACTTDSLLFDDRETHTVGGFVSTLASGVSPQWRTSNVASFSAPNSWFGKDTSVTRDLRLSSAQIVLKKGSQLSFRHFYNTEAGWDGGVVEISTDNGANYSDLGSKFVVSGYNGTIGTGAPLAGRKAFTGNSGGFINSVISLRAYDNMPVRIRFRAANDNSVAVVGWYVDNIILQTGCGEYNKATVRNAADIFVDSSTSNNFVFSTPVVVLPLELLSFSAQKQKENVLLSWNTTNELNSDRFEVERSTDQSTWTKIGTVTAFNNGAANNDYHLTDNKPVFGLNYYRLKMLDKDGKFVYSSIRVVRFTGNSGFAIKPNPADDKLTVVFNSNSNTQGTILVHDLPGKEVMKLAIGSAASFVTINTNALANGTYLISFVNGETTYTERFIVNHK